MTMLSENNRWRDGDWAIYRKSKRSKSPGPRAENIFAAPKGDTYTYVVDKFWVVESVLADGRLRLRTAGGKTHVILLTDPNLRRPSFIQRLFWRERFRLAEEKLSNSPGSLVTG